MNDIITGVVIGATAGLVTAVVTGLWGWLGRRLQRREQTAYIRGLVTEGMESIRSAGALPPPPGETNPIPADCIRYALFRNLPDSLRVALSYRATRLTYPETSSSQQVLAEVENMCTELEMYSRKAMPPKIADIFRERLQELKWLGLPK